MSEYRNDRLRLLLIAYIDDSISEAEWEELVRLVRESKGDTALGEAIDLAWAASDQEKPVLINSDKIYRQIMTDHRIVPIKMKRKKIGIKVWSSIGGIAALICLGIFLYFQAHLIDEQSTPNKEVEVADGVKPIVPGNKKAILTLADGQQIVLDSMPEHALALQLGYRIKKEAGKLVYIDTATAVHPSNFHTVSTPFGGEFELVLPDGTKVWLNAGSSLAYPTKFDPKQRAVKLMGEAYFEVAKNKDRPFIVDANGTTIKVLGTEFNVSAYNNEKIVKTTLVTGAVLVKSKTLTPGQQAVTFLQSEKIEIRSVDIQEETAWRRGYFFFADEDLPTVMNTLARWYNIEVSYQGDLRNKTFGGTISRYEDFHQLLKAIELTGSVHFQINGRRVMVSP